MLHIGWFITIEILWLVVVMSAIAFSSLLPWRSLFSVLVAVVGVAAAVAGGYSAFCIRWMPSPTLVFLGFPYPAFVWQLEDGQWVDYVGGPITAAMDVALFVAVATLPLLVWSLIRKVGKPSRTPRDAAR